MVFDKITVSVERDENELIRSMYKQLVKDVTDYNETLGNFCDELEDLFNYNKVLSVWKDVFSNAHFVSKYSRSIVEDFVSFLDKNCVTNKIEHVNLTWSNENCI